MATTRKLSDSTLRQHELHARRRERVAERAETLASARFLDEWGVEQMFSLRVASLRTWRCRGGGPPFVKRGTSVRYDVQAVERWLRGDDGAAEQPRRAGGARGGR